MNHCFSDPPPAVTDVPGTRFGRSVPAVPQVTLDLCGVVAGVSQLPVAKVKLPETEKPSRMWMATPVVAQLSFAEGQLVEIVAAHLVAHVEARVAFLGGEILPVLRTVPELPLTELASSMRCEY